MPPSPPMMAMPPQQPYSRPIQVTQPQPQWNPAPGSPAPPLAAPTLAPPTLPPIARGKAEDAPPVLATRLRLTGGPPPAVTLPTPRELGIPDAPPTPPGSGVPTRMP